MPKAQAKVKKPSRTEQQAHEKRYSKGEAKTYTENVGNGKTKTFEITTFPTGETKRRLVGMTKKGKKLF